MVFHCEWLPQGGESTQCVLPYGWTPVRFDLLLVTTKGKPETFNVVNVSLRGCVLAGA